MWKKNPSAEQILRRQQYVIQGTDDLCQKRKTYSFLAHGTDIDIRPVILPINLTLWPVY